MLSHDVYFTLHDASESAKAKLILACRKFLARHHGEVSFTCGTLCQELRREVNDVAFDVALHIVFENKAAHDAYQTAPRHELFIEDCKANWKKVRVFDSEVERA